MRIVGRLFFFACTTILVMSSPVVAKAICSCKHKGKDQRELIKLRDVVFTAKAERNGSAVKLKVIDQFKSTLPTELSIAKREMSECDLNLNSFKNGVIYLFGVHKWNFPSSNSIIPSVCSTVIEVSTIPEVMRWLRQAESTSKPVQTIKPSPTP